MASNFENSKKALKSFVTRLIDRGYSITMHDYEEDNTLVRSTSVDDVMKNSCSTDMEFLEVFDGEVSLGMFSLVWGNSPWELLSDHTVNDFCNAEWDWFEETMFKRYYR